MPALVVFGRLVATVARELVPVNRAVLHVNRTTHALRFIEQRSMPSWIDVNVVEDVRHRRDRWCEQDDLSTGIGDGSFKGSQHVVASSKARASDARGPGNDRSGSLRTARSSCRYDC